MRNDTRLKFNAFLAQLATLNGVGLATEKFSVVPTVQQTLETRIQESAGFLGLVNMIGVTEKTGAKLGLGVTGPVASRTDTTQKDRSPRDVSDLSEDDYSCAKTDFDTAIPYALLDAWAKFPDFQERLRNLIIQRQALDRMCVGFNGKTVAANTDLATNPLLQDVNKGWLQYLRDNKPANVMSAGNTAGKITVGPGGDYKNLDALVYDAVTLLDPWYQDNPGLRAIVGRKLLHDKYFPKVNSDQDAQNELATQMLVTQRTIGGQQGLVVPFAPANSVLITAPSNLSLYWQEGARRRQVIDEPKRDRIANYESSNDAYVVEDAGMAVLVENIEFIEA
jgi:phage major capsid protein, P2 family